MKQTEYAELMDLMLAWEEFKKIAVDMHGYENGFNNGVETCIQSLRMYLSSKKWEGSVESE